MVTGKASPEECQQYCQGLSSCVFFTYHGTSGICYPKNVVPTISHTVPQVTAGPKHC